MSRRSTIPRRFPGPDRLLRPGTRGLTLVEVLVAIFVMGVGLLALLTLFPLGILSMRQAVNDDRARLSATALSAAVAAYRQQFGVLPGTLADLTPLLGGDDRYEDGEDSGYRFRLDANGSVLAEPAAAGKTAVRSYCKPVDGPLKDCTTLEDLEAAALLQALTRENLLVRAAEASAELLRSDVKGLAPDLVRPFLAARSLQEGFALLDGNGNGQVTLRELTTPLFQDPVLHRYAKDSSEELALGAGDEEIDTLPGVGPNGFPGDPGLVFTLDTLRLLVGRYARPPGAVRALTAHLDRAEWAGLQGKEAVRKAALGAFARQVTALQGKALGEREAEVLLTLAAAL